jgi:hypothetical protein
MRAYLLGFATLALTACGTDIRDEDDIPPDPEPRATWHQDVAPIVAEHCMGCHQPGGIGPFDLTVYDTAYENAGRMVAEIDKGAMPPFDAREEADCTPRFGWVDDPRLSADEIETIKVWIEDGRAEGIAAPAPKIPGVELAGVTQTLKPVVPFTASGMRDQFICYVLDPQTQGTWLTGLQVRPGNPLVVHHVVLTELTPGAEHDAVVAQHGIGMPWDCSQEQTPGFTVNVWTPGNQPMQTSTDLAVPIVGGAKLVMQLHYHAAGMTAEPDATSIDLRTSLTWPKKMYFVGAFGNEFQAPNLLPDPDDRTTPEFRIPANKADHNEHMRITVPPLGDLTQVQLYSMNPHMHMIGTHISARIERPAARGTDPQNECLANGKWNFDWQRTYIYDTTLEKLPTLRPGDVVDLKCKFDNTMANPFVQRALEDAGLIAPIDVTLGEQSLDEMCLEIMGLAIDAPAPPMAASGPTNAQLPLHLLETLRINRNN